MAAAPAMLPRPSILVAGPQARAPEPLPWLRSAERSARRAPKAWRQVQPTVAQAVSRQVVVTVVMILMMLVAVVPQAVVVALLQATARTSSPEACRRSSRT
jgi:hypothetical protein